MIKLENIQKVFRTEEVETVALGGVSFEVKKGEFVAIMGPSVCGKSTLLNILGLLDNPTSGTYLLDGENVGQLKESHRTKVRKGQIGFVFQSFNLIDELNVEENVELPLTYLGVPKKERKQRVAIARAVVMNPKLILADEPTGNLDSKNGLEVMQLLTQLNQEGTTVLMVTHSERDAGYAQRIINLLDGQVVPEVKL